MSGFSINFLADPTCFAVNRLAAHCDFIPQEDQYNSVRSLNGSWWFRYAENPDGVNWNFVKHDFDCKGWEKIKVPAQIQTQGYDRPHYVNRMYPWDGTEEVKYPQVPMRFNPVAQYVKYFSIEKMPQRIFVSFQGVETGFALWLNGEFVGYSEDSYTPADFELTKFVRQGENKIAVAVFKFTTGSWLEDQDFWRMSGLMRDVFLYTTPDSRICDFYFSTNVNPEHYSANVELFVELEHVQQGQSLCYRVVAPDEAILTESRVNAKTELKIPISLTSLRLWSAETPYLYKLELELQDESGRILQRIYYPIGFKRSEVRDGIWYINGKRLVINGVNRHDFSSVHGRSVTREEMLWDVIQMKRNNINAVRTCHYPNQSYFYELCSRLGLYVMDETNLETHGTWKYGQDSLENALPGSHPEWRAAVVDRTTSMFERDKNRTCVISWSLGNESYGGENFRAMKDEIRKKDCITPIHYEGVWHCTAFSDVTDVTSGMYVPVKKIKEILEEPSEKPFILCEYSHAMGNSCGGLHKYTELTETYKQYQGGFIWDFIDQTLATRDQYGNQYLACGGDFGDIPNDANFCANGLMFGNRTVSPKMQLVKNNYQPIKFVFGNNSVDVTNKMLFKNLNEYDIRWSVSVDGDEIDSRHMDWSVSPGEKRRFELPPFKLNRAGEYIQTLSVCLKENTQWAPKGYELMFGQKIVNNVQNKPEGKFGKLRVENSEQNIGVYGENFSCMFARKAGGIISYKVGSKELITTMPKPNFWRAPTCNDLGNKMDYRLAAWKTAGLYAKSTGFREEISDLFVRIYCEYSLALPENPVCRIIYTVYPNGDLHVEQTFDGMESLPEMPEFSWMIGMDPSVTAMRWYGYGPEDTYEDTLQNARIAVFESTVSKCLQPYIGPQECGNKCGVRWLEMADHQGVGIRIRGEKLLQISALPFNPHQMEAFKKVSHLPKPYETVLRVSSRKMGVGGDNSWGARVHPEYCIPGDAPQRLSFTITPLIR